MSILLQFINKFEKNIEHIYNINEINLNSEQTEFVSIGKQETGSTIANVIAISRNFVLESKNIVSGIVRKNSRKLMKAAVLSLCCQNSA